MERNLVVAKVINRNICEARKNLVMREFEIMTKLHHPNIVQFLGYIDYPFIIVMEYIPKGDLQKNIPKLKKSEKLLITNDILRALAYIHNRLPHSLIHRKITRKCTKQFHIINYYQELVLNLVNNKIIQIYPLIYFQELGLVQLMQ